MGLIDPLLKNYFKCPECYIRDKKLFYYLSRTSKIKSVTLLTANCDFPGKCSPFFPHFKESGKKVTFSPASFFPGFFEMREKSTSGNWTQRYKVKEKNILTGKKCLFSPRETLELLFFSLRSKNKTSGVPLGEKSYFFYRLINSYYYYDF